MIRKTFKPAIIALIGAVLMSCSNNTSEEKTTEAATASTTVLDGRVMTKEQQDQLTPDQVIHEFKDGNARFVDGTLTARDHSAQVTKTADGQFPKAIILSCVDSRVPVEDVFDQGIGDIFVARVAGNFANVDLLGSMEFATKVAGAKLVVVMGHEHCGAVKGAIDNVKLGNLTPMLAKIKPAVANSQDFKGDKNTKNADFVTYVSENNVKNTIKEIRANSPILKEMEDKGQIKIVGAYYKLTDGKVQFLD